MTKNKFLFFTITVSILILIYLLNSLYPLYCDDWEYSLIYGNPEREKLKTIKDLFISQKNHYMMWGGRTVAHTIAQILLVIKNNFIIDLINAIIYTDFILIVYMYTSLKRYDYKLLLLVALSLYIVLPDFCSTVLWITGSCNYLWTTLLCLVFMYPFVQYYLNGDIKVRSKFFFPLAFLSGIVVGWTNENMGIAILFFIISLAIVLKIEKRQIPIWFWVGMVGVLIGSLFLILAPGNFVRAAVIKSRSAVVDQQVEYVNRVKHIISLLRSNISIYLMAYLFLLLLLTFREKLSIVIKNKRVILSFIFLMSGLISFFVMIASPVFPQRALFGAYTLLLISNLYLFAIVIDKLRDKRIIWYSLLGLLLLYCSIDYYWKYETLSRVNEIWEERYEYIEENSKNLPRVVVFDKSYGVHPKYALDDIQEDPKFWINQQFSKYLDVDSVIVRKRAAED